MDNERRAFLKRSFVLISGFSLTACGVSPENVPAGDVQQTLSITTQPADQSVLVGNTATFQVVVSGQPPFTYQWRKNDIIIEGAESDSYITAALEVADTGSIYSVVVTNDAESVASVDARLTVNQQAGNIDPASITVDSTLIAIDSTQITIDGA